MSKRRKDIQYFQSEFIVRIEDTPMYRKEHGLMSLTSRSNIAGIGIETEKIGKDLVLVKSRSRMIRFFIQDRNFLHRNLEHYGIITQEEIQGITWIRKNRKIVQYIVKDNILKPKFRFEYYKEYDIKKLYNLTTYPFIYDNTDKTAKEILEELQ